MGSYSHDDHVLRQILVYCGTPSSGKSCNLHQAQTVFDPTRPAHQVAGEEGGVWLQAGPAAIPLPLHPEVTLNLTVRTVPGGIDQSRSWREILISADGLVFVVDAQRHRLRDNLIAWADLLENLRTVGRDPYQIPIVMQYNKMDAESCMDLADLEAAVNAEGFPSFEASATDGRGVGKCFSEVVRRMAARAHADLGMESRGVPRAALSSAVDAVLSEMGSRAARRLAGDTAAEPVLEAPDLAMTDLPRAQELAEVEEVVAEVEATPAALETPTVQAPARIVREPVRVISAVEDREQRERDLYFQLWKNERETRLAQAAQLQHWLSASQSFASNAQRAGTSLRQLLHAVETEAVLVPSLEKAVKEGSKLVRYLATLPGHLVQRAGAAVPAEADCVPLEQPIESAWSALAAVAAQTRVELHWPSLPAVLGDLGLLEVAWHELLRDAVTSYRGQEGRIEVVVRQRAGHCVVALRGPFEQSEWGCEELVDRMLRASGGRLRLVWRAGLASWAVIRLGLPDQASQPEPSPRAVEYAPA